VKLAAAALDSAIRAPAFEPGEMGADIKVHRMNGRSLVAFETSPAAQPDLVDSLRLAFDADQQLRNQQEAARRGGEYLDRARTAGATLCTLQFDLPDTRILLSHCSAEVELGSTEWSSAQRRSGDGPTWPAAYSYRSARPC
jgi:hypothetical protein